jgi:hypothetical protein
VDVAGIAKVTFTSPYCVRQVNNFNGDGFSSLRPKAPGAARPPSASPAPGDKEKGKIDLSSLRVG